MGPTDRMHEAIVNLGWRRLWDDEGGGKHGAGNYWPLGATSEASPLVCFPKEAHWVDRNTFASYFGMVMVVLAQDSPHRGRLFFFLSQQRALQGRERRGREMKYTFFDPYPAEHGNRAVAQPAWRDLRF